MRVESRLEPHRGRSGSERLAEHYVWALRSWCLATLAEQTSADTGAWTATARNLDAWLMDRWSREIDRPATVTPDPGYAQALFACNMRLMRKVLEGINIRTQRPEPSHWFEEAVGPLSDDVRSWRTAFDPSAAAFWEQAALVWICLCHLGCAGVAPREAQDLIVSAVDRGEPPAIKPELRVVDRQTAPLAAPAMTAPATATSPSMTPAVLGHAGRAASAVISAIGLVAKLLAVSSVNLTRMIVARVVAAEALSRQQRMEAIAAANSFGARTPLRHMRLSDRSVAQGTVRLHGPDLRRSIVPTWLMLVVCSWVSLLWGGLISAPFGIGLGILATLFAGIIAVPLWGTVWGFLGMGAARDSTLRQMEFSEVPADHPLKATTAKFARALAIPTPRVGTVAAHNAFAMGTHVDDATVAIGRPLLTSLTSDQVDAIIGHELGHVVSGDMRRMMLMRTFQNATVWYMMSQGAKQVVRWIICWAAELYILAFSRRREYWADAIGATLAGKDAMIGALRALEKAPALTNAENTHARFMFRGRVLSTHPSMAERIAALEAETYIRRLPIREVVGLFSQTLFR